MDLPIKLQSNEKLVSTIRRHPVGLIGRLVGIGVIVLLVFVGWLTLGQDGDFLSTIFNIALIIAVAGGVIIGLMEWYRYQNDVWLVTNQRLVDSTKTSPFSHRVSSADLVNVQDINIEKSGIFQTMFDYGDVRCQTASASTEVFTLHGVPKPAEVLDLIDDTRDAARQERMHRLQAVANDPVGAPAGE